MADLLHHLLPAVRVAPDLYPQAPVHLFDGDPLLHFLCPGLFVDLHRRRDLFPTQ